MIRDRYLVMSTTIHRDFAAHTPSLKTSTLGSLLRSHRTTSGASLKDLASESGFSEVVIESVEAGQHDLDLDSLVVLIEAFEPPTLRGSGRFANVVVDIETVSVALVDSKELVSNLPAADRILGHYLDFLYADRHLPMGTRLSIREVDLSVVRDSLALRREAVTGHIERLEVAPPGSVDRTHLVLLTGLLCATAALVVGGGPSSQGPADAVPEAVASVVEIEEAPAVAPGDVVVQIGSAVSITRAPAQIEDSSAGAEVTVEIGTAVVEER